MICVQFVRRELVVVHKLHSVLAEVFHQHNVRVRGLILGVEERGAVGRQAQTFRFVEWLLQREDWGCLAGCKVEELNSPVWLSTRIDKIDSCGGERPVEPG